MASRTNKRGIAAKKAKLQKQASIMKGTKRFEYPKRRLELDSAKDLNVVGVQTNPRGNTYHWFLRGRKVCRETRMRIDPDGYRYVRTPAGGSEIVNVTMSGWVRTAMRKRMSAGSGA